MNNQAKVILTGEDKLSAVFASVGRSADKLGLNLDGLKGGAVAALGALAVPVSAGALVALANEARQAIDEIKDLSDATGSSVENISALDGIARDVGASIGDVSGVLIKFNAVLKDADPDKGAGAVLKALNLDIAELKRLDPAEALRRTAVALQGYADDGDKARAVQELFGKSVKEAGPFLKELAEAGALNARITSEQAEEVDRFNKELFKLQAAANDAGRSITISIITALNEAIDKFREGRREGKSTFELWAKYLPLLNGPAGAAGFIVSSAIGDASQNGGRSASGSIIDQSDPRAALRRLEREQDTRPSLNVPDDPNKKNTRTGGASTPKDPYADANRYLDSLRKQLQATEALTVYEKLLADLRVGALGKTTPAIEEQLKQTARQIDADKELAQLSKDFAKLEEEAAKKRAELAEEGRRLWEETRTPLEQLNIETARLQKLLDDGVISFDTFARKSLALEEALRDGPTTAISELDQFTQRAAQNIQDALGNSFQQLMEGNFRNIGDAFTQMLNNMVAQAAAAQFSKYLFGDLLTGGGGGSNGALGDLLGSAASALFGGIPSYDVGTDFVPKDQLALVHKGERIVPAAENRPGFGGTSHNYSINVTMPSGASRSTGQQFGREIARQLSIANARNG